MAPTLFNMMFLAMLTDAFQDCYAGLPIIYIFGYKLFNLRRLQAESKLQTDVLDKLLHADEMTENAKTERKIQGTMDRVSQACGNYEYKISTKDGT